MKIIFLGTPNYAVPFLKTLVEAGRVPVIVITQPDQPTGRNQVVTPPPVKVTAHAYHIPLWQPENINTDEWKKRLTAEKPDLIVTVAFGQIISKDILSIPRLGCINIHPSLLPKHRGATPLQSSILTGNTETGVTIMMMDEKMDHGAILAQEKIALDPRETTETLIPKTTHVAAQLLLETIQKLEEGAATPKEQDHEKATYTKMLTRESGRIDWTKSVKEVDQQVRALTPWPGTFTMWQEKRLKILQAHPFEKQTVTKKEVGQLFKETIEDKTYLLAQCADGQLAIDQLQPEGKKPMSAQDFIVGYLK